jgi:DNA-binding PadR family transcriptional regulator
MSKESAFMTNYAALHEPLVEWVYEQTTAQATDYVTITPFGESHGLDLHQSFELLLACKAWGLLSDRYATMGAPAASLTPRGLRWIHERRERRADPRARSAAARTGLLTWLWEQKEQGRGFPVVEGILESPHSLFEGVRLTPGEIDRAGAYLLAKGLITGSRSGQSEGPVRAEITAEGQDCVEHFDGDVSSYERRNSSGNTTFNITENTGNIAANSRDFTMNATTSKDGINLEQVVLLARALRQAVPALELPEDDASEISQLATRLETEANTGSPDPARLQRWGGNIIAILNSPVVSGALGSVLAAYTGTVLPGLPSS